MDPELRRLYLQDLKEIEGEIERFGANVELLLEKAEILDFLGRQADSLGVLRQGLAQEPDNPDLWNNVGVVYKNMSRYQDSFEALIKSQRLSPNRTVTLKNIGDVLFFMYRDDEARLWYERALKHDRNDPWALTGKGQILVNANHYNKALELFDRALAVEPDYAWALGGRGMALLGLGHFEDALESFQEAIDLDPEWDHPHCGKAEALHRLGNLKEAEVEYRTALRLDELDPLKWQDLGNVLLDLTRYRDALRAFRRAAHLDPELGRAHSGMAHALDMLGKGEEALAEYDKALAIDGDDPSIWNNRAVLLAENLQRPDEALTSYDHALEAEPDYHLARFNRAQLLARMDRAAEAVEQLRRVTELVSRHGSDAIPELRAEDFEWMETFLADHDE